MATIDNAVIYCARRSSTFGLSTPDCLALVGGRPLIHGQLELLDDAANIIVVLGHQAPDVMRAVLSKRSDAVFAMNHDHQAGEMSSLRAIAAYLKEDFVYLDGGTALDSDALERVAGAPCPCMAVCRASSEHPAYVKLGEGGQSGLVVSLTTEPEEYEWAGIAKLHPYDIKLAEGSTHIHQAIARALPMPAIEVACAEVLTDSDAGQNGSWATRTSSKDDSASGLAVA